MAKIIQFPKSYSTPDRKKIDKQRHEKAKKLDLGEVFVLRLDENGDIIVALDE